MLALLFKGLIVSPVSHNACLLLGTGWHWPGVGVLGSSSTLQRSRAICLLQQPQQTYDTQNYERPEKRKKGN